MPRFIVRNNHFFYRAVWVDQTPRGYPKVQRDLIGPFATLRAAWDARFGS